MTQSVFTKYDSDSYPYRFTGELHLDVIVGGVPSDPKVAEGWIRSKIQDTDDRIRELVAETMADRKKSAEEALAIVNEMKNLNGFKRDVTTALAKEAQEKALLEGEDPEVVMNIGELYVEGRQLKAALKEAVSVAAGADKVDMTGWGKTRKWLTNFFPEHVFVVEEKLYLGVVRPHGIFQQFVHTHRGSSIQYQEYVQDATISFTIIADHPFSQRDWGMIWTTGEKQGLGASRSQGYGTYQVTKWEDTAKGPKPEPVRVSTRKKN
jgi:hypothetical protein